jgi:hypothetical protein
MGLIENVCEDRVQAINQLIETFFQKGWQLIQI